MSHESEDADAIIEIHEHSAAFGHVSSIVVRHAGGADRSAAPIDEDDDRALLTRLRVSRSPNIHVEAVFSRGLLAKVVIDVMWAKNLHAFRTLTICIPHACPFDRLRSFPAQVAHWRRCERNSEICLHTRLHLSARDETARCVHWITSNRVHLRTHTASANERHDRCKRIAPTSHVLLLPQQTRSAN